MTNCRQRMLYGRTSANKSSRFLDEIPVDNMRWESKPAPRFGGMEDDTFGGDRYESSFGGFGSGYAQPRTSGTSWSSGGVHGYRDTGTKPAPQKPLVSTRRTSAAPPTAMMQLNQGDMVEHTAFGKGMVMSVRPMGGDALVEVAFDNLGTKKLMLKSAGSHMKKL